METAFQQPATLQIRTMNLELVAHAAPATPAPFLGLTTPATPARRLTELGAEHALTWLAQTAPVDRLIVHACPSTRVPYLGPTELGVELALRQLAALHIQTMLLELIAHATPATRAKYL